jgi:hypothetical protein
LTAVDDEEHFLSRWSRRKLESKQDAPAALPAAELPAAALPVAEPAAPAARATESEMAPGISTEYRQFFDPKVDEKLRQAALRGLFSDPHFNVMDGLDTYIDDYSVADPLPEGMLRRLNQAKDLFLFDEENKTAEGTDTAAATGEGAAVASVAAADTSTLPDVSPAPASDEQAADGTGAAAAPSAEGGTNA